MKEGTAITVRIPRPLLERLRTLARGDGTRPRASLTSTLIFVLERGLAAVEAEDAAGGHTTASTAENTAEGTTGP